ncbi:Gmad2 immunoglobulin-like domain-containing protein [Lentzea sp. HUAS12]|uniref:Gmad2 immunoglobulin-like domain-containing protein n=1 Tax=Lentzea sp. HUAS12 TaxID=2951806 RepID=UPI00209CE7D1|nr:Gmad2 immunoglobulin-like domain-containing protein [Lentzea sp. HUAS12]USX54518.1 Gmad2 immunoglobulin-like domain-containing protein [Lentzea sp. HUAS12]
MTRRTRIVIAATAAVLVVAALVAVVITTRRDRSEPAAPTSTTATPAPSSASRETTNLVVYFHRGAPGDPREVVAVPRSVPKTAAVATAALNALLPGPTEAERGSGHWSMFGPGTARSLRSVRVADGVAYADFQDFRAAVPDASSSFGSAALLAELDTTLKQFPTVKSTVYSFGGDVPAFYHWLQLPAPGLGDEADAVAQARLFLIQVAGMRVVFGGPFRRTGNGQAELTCYPAHPDDDTRPVTTLPTVVSLQRSGDRWVVTGTRAEAIQVDAPEGGDVVRSPVAVSGRAHVFEGTVSVRVLTGKGAVEIGRGFVTGGGDVPRPFSGRIGFAQPNGGDGWVLFQEESAANGDIVLTTAVPVRFAGVPEPSATVQS